MKIGIMLRGLDKRGGIGVYARNLVPRLVRLGKRHDWVLLHPSEEQLGMLSLDDAGDVEERVLAAATWLQWDQWRVPAFARRRELDLLFNVKFTVPLWGPVPTVMAVHGMSWYVIPRCYSTLEIAYIRLAMPRYAARAAHLVSNSRCTTDDYVRILGVPRDKITTAHLAAADHFGRVADQAELDRVRQRYGLPDSFVLSVGADDPRKNVPRLLEAFARCHERVPCKLVLVGRGCERFRQKLPGVMARCGDDLVFPGWIPQEDLPAVYSMASVFFFPSLYEEFGIPNCEALACGLPVVSSSVGAPPEVVGDAGILVDPHDVDGMADALFEVLSDGEVRASLARRAAARSALFSWDETARRTLRALESAR